MAPAVATAVTTVIKKKVPEKYHIEWLLSMLWGGVAMLIIEHIAHKEVVPYFPFFTAGFREMLPEILRAGIPMTLFIFVIWGSMLLGVSLAEKKKLKRLEA